MTWMIWSDTPYSKPQWIHLIKNLYSRRERSGARAIHLHIPLIFIDIHWYSLIFIDIHWYSLFHEKHEKLELEFLWTKEDIDRGIAGRPCPCPLRRAMAEMFGKSIGNLWNLSDVYWMCLSRMLKFEIWWTSLQDFAITRNSWQWFNDIQCMVRIHKYIKYEC